MEHFQDIKLMGCKIVDIWFNISEKHCILSLQIGENRQDVLKIQLRNYQNTTELWVIGIYFEQKQESNAIHREIVKMLAQAILAHLDIQLQPDKEFDGYIQILQKIEDEHLLEQILQNTRKLYGDIMMGIENDGEWLFMKSDETKALVSSQKSYYL